jgi:GT2 family glycosyltransferase
MLDRAGAILRHQVPGNEWARLRPPPGATWTPHRRVSVCIPARATGQTLHRTLSALALQTYPADLIEVIVADDSSAPPLDVSESDVPFTVTVLRQDADGFAAGRARALAASAAAGEVLVFLDVDVVPSRSVIESYLRWFERCDAVVPFGFLSFVDMTAMSEAELEVAIRDHDLAAFDRLGRVDDQHWRERTFGETADLQHESSDMFRTLVGASLAVSAEQYASVGGFCDLGVRGIEDIEFGYRLQNNGALLIPDRGALHWHQGGRTMSGDRVAAIRQGRAPFADALLPIGRFRGARPAAGSPVPVVPRLLVHVDPGVVDADVLADQIRLADGADVEVRIGLPDDSFVTAFAQVALTAPMIWQPGVAAAITLQLVERNLGTLLIVGVAGTPVLEVIRTRAIRAERRGDASTLISRKLFPVGVADASKVRLVPEKSGPLASLARVQSIRHCLDGVVAVLRERLQLAQRRPRPPESERSTS